VLIVEDDQTTRTMFQNALRAEGFRILTAGDGVEALRVLDVETPSVIVLDLGLPRLGGHDVAREVLARPETALVPIVVVTGADTEGLPESPRIRILRKPTTPDVIVETVQRCLETTRRFRYHAD
jgi:DNA-binding response OmpR family regulator